MKPTIGILSIGQMGAGIAKFLVATNYRVITNVSTRSQATKNRAQEAKVELAGSDEELVAQSDYIFSIVPPKDAAATARRIIDALKSASSQQRTSPLYYLELNAVSPRTVSTIAAAFSEQAPEVRFIDGAIIGGPPRLNEHKNWDKPSFPLSGPHRLDEAPCSGSHLATILSANHISDTIGSASGLKCCFAALAKGTTALALQSYSTAASLNVLPALEHYLDVYNPKIGERVRAAMPACPPKAYRWVEEMNQIGQCFAEDGGWAEQARVFREIAGVYEGLAKVVEQRGGTKGLENVEGVVESLRVGSGRGRRMSLEDLAGDLDEG
jgi:hypothetical protein